MPVLGLAKSLSNVIIFVYILVFVLFLSLFISARLKDWKIAGTVFKVLFLIVYVLLGYSLTIGMIFRNSLSGTLTGKKIAIFSTIAVLLFIGFVLLIIYA